MGRVGNLAREVAMDRMAWLDRELAQRQHIAGENYSIADITAQAAFVLGKNTGTSIPEELSHLRRWFAQVSSRPSARA